MIGQKAQERIVRDVYGRICRKYSIDTEQMRAAIIVNIGKIDKKSLYGRITAIGDAFMKPSTMNKAKKVLAFILAASAL